MTESLITDSNSQSSFPKCAIQRLSTEVVNRIAAGEVIQRPSNAIKELLENCLDAGSTQIQITVRDGGLKLIQVQDNGCGIKLDDLSILCERFTTSKLKEFSDLGNLVTFGFRGEALASLSHVSLVTVITRTFDQVCAYKAKYRTGVLESKPTPCAGNLGTTVIIEDLFYNTPLRKAALKSTREEFHKLTEVVSQYAIHYAPKCGFYLHSANSGHNTSNQDLRTTAGWSRMDAVQAVAGAAVAQNLLPITSTQCSVSESTRLAVERFGLRYEGLLTAPNQISSGCTPTLKLNLFINNRMVDCIPVKRALECSYSAVLSRSLVSNNLPLNRKLPISRSNSNLFKSSVSKAVFVYLNLQLPANTIDVNVHPTKAEVHFLHEDVIVNGLQDAVEQCLLSSAQIRSFVSEPLSSGKVKSISDVKTVDFTKLRKSDINYNSPYPSTSPLSITQPKDKIRIDIREQKLEKFMLSHSNCAISQKETQNGVINPIHSPDIEIDSDAADDILNETDIIYPAQNSLFTSEHMTGTSNIITSTQLRSCQNQSGTLTICDRKVPLSDCPIIRKEKLPNSPIQLDSCSSLSRGSHTPPHTWHRPNCSAIILSLRHHLKSNLDKPFRKYLNSCKYIGSLDHSRCLVQHSKDLLLVKLGPLTRALFYQLLLDNFANYGEIVFDKPIALSELLSIGYDYAMLLSTDFILPNQNCHEFVQKSNSLLLNHAPLLWDYFSIKIYKDNSEELVISQIPLILNNYTPDLKKLPIFIVELVTKVSWSVESTCLNQICCVLANFYAITRPITKEIASNEEIITSINYTNTNCKAGVNEENCQNLTNSKEWALEHVIWASVTKKLLPSRNFPNLSSDPSVANDKINLQSAFIHLTSLTDLYKVFERC